MTVGEGVDVRASPKLQRTWNKMALLTAFLKRKSPELPGLSLNRGDRTQSPQPLCLMSAVAGCGGLWRCQEAIAVTVADELAGRMAASPCSNVTLGSYPRSRSAAVMS
jgi:hypothetical protein